MTTKNRSIATQIGRAIAADNLDSTGTFLTTGSQGVIVYGADYTASSDLAAVDSSTLVDGSLHYLSKLNEMYIWDDSDGAFYSITLDGASAPVVYSFQGSVSGYTSGGRSFSPAATNIIDKFPFATNANATDVGDLTLASLQAAGQSSSDNGYTSGGGGAGIKNIIEKFPFAVDANATDVGDLTVARRLVAGQSSSDNGYTSGGYTPSLSNVIDKFTFSSDANATDVGNLTSSRGNSAGQSSSDNGYTSGGSPTQYGIGDTIDKFPFSSDANATDVGNLTLNRRALVGQSSTVNGYSSGNHQPGSNIIDKFPFATNANATDVGDLSVSRGDGSGQSSTTNGYTSGGSTQPSPSGNSNVIDKFPFSSDANATDVGNLTVPRRFKPAGQQV